MIEGIVGGWRLTAINTMTSGLPVNLNYSPSSTFSVSAAPTYRPNLVGDVYGDRQRSTTTSTATTSSSRPIATQPFGNAPRNVARGPAIYSLDLGLHKGFGLGLGDSRLEFRIEAFNALNKTQLRRAERQPLVDRLRDDSHAVDDAAADSAGSEAGFLIPCAGLVLRKAFTAESAEVAARINVALRCRRPLR